MKPPLSPSKDVFRGRRIYLLAAITLALALCVALYLSRQRPVPPVEPGGYALGTAFSYFTVPVPGIPDAPAAWREAATIADYAWIHRYWGADYESPGYAADVQAAQLAGLKLYISLGPFDESKTSVSVPGNLKRADGSPCSGDFATPCVQEAYVEAVKSIARTYQPDYFVMGVEVNLYAGPDYLAYVQTYKRAYDAIQQDPSIGRKPKMAASFAFNPKDPRANATALRRFLKEFSDVDQITHRESVKLDVLAVSLYFPFWNVGSDPKDIPLDAFSSIMDVAGTSLPLFVSETGWISRPFRTFSASESSQASYIDRLKQIAAHAESLGKKIDVITYVALVDMGGPCTQPQNVVETVDVGWYCYLGLIKPDGSPKLAHSAMRQWKAELAAGPLSGKTK